MTDILTHFPPTAAHARDRLAAFAPLAGSAYAMRRNFDYGPGMHGSVSVLSPYVRLRMLDEVAMSRIALAHHSAQEAEKFLAEVFWRTYWKGWMELRPTVWEDYQSDLARLRNEIQTQSGLRARWQDACLGQTGIAPFDAWAHELAQTGYLHNHARMWFASIWVFTLNLPWQLGADFFLRHLLDGDAAVNTLSWRWVAGIQTPGKTYLARADNIAKFTNGRFSSVAGLAQTAVPPQTDVPPAPRLLPRVPEPDRGAPYGLLLHDDDIDAARLIKGHPTPASWAYLDTSSGHSPWQMAPHVSAFRCAAAQDQAQGETGLSILKTAQDLRDWAVGAGVEQIVTPYAPVSPTQAVLAAYTTLPDAPPLHLDRRPLDTQSWPLATKGFFPFRKHIPQLISEFVERG